MLITVRLGRREITRVVFIMKNQERLDKLLKMIQTEPDDAFCLYAIAQEYGQLGELDTAISYYDRVIASDPHYHYAYFHKAKAMEKIGKGAEIKPVLEEGYRLAQEDGEQQAISELRDYIAECTG